jgi:hypothetical protein
MVIGGGLSNQPIGDSVTFKAGIAQYRLGKVVSAWRMNTVNTWVGPGLNL